MAERSIGISVYDTGMLRVEEIAGQLKAAWEGQGGLDITGVAPLESAGAGDIAFVGNRKAAANAAESRAGCVLVTEDFPKGRTLVRVADPRGAFAQVVRLLFPRAAVVPGIHASAVIESGALIDASAAVGPLAVIGAGTSIGKRCSIGAGCAIGSSVQIGSDCVLHSNVTIYDNVTVGDRAVLHSGCVLGAEGFGILTSKIVRKNQVVWGTPARPLKQHLEQLANLARLPELRKEVERLKKT